MVKVDEIIKKASSFLKVGVVKDGEIVEIVDEGELIPAEKTRFGRDVFRIRVRLENGEEKLWNMNISTINRLARAYGNDTRNWVGKKVKIKYREVELDDRTVITLDGYPVKEEDADLEEMRKLVEALRKSGMTTISKKELVNVAKLRGIRKNPIELAKKLGLKVTETHVEL